jgi:hypothetical protein
MSDLNDLAAPRLRSVILAAPSYDGRVGVWHVAALAETCKIGLANGINVMPLYVSFDSLVQRARNDIVKAAVDAGVDDLVFVDCDQDWNPPDFFRLLSHDVDIVAAPVVKKSDVEMYNVKLSGELKVQDNGLIEVDGVGTGFMRIRKDALRKIYDAADEYTERHKPEPTKMVFDVRVIDGELYSEDIVFCRKWIDMGGKVYVDPTIDSGHSGEKRWVGSFYNWVKLASKK